MQFLAQEILIQQLNWRCAVKKFAPQKKIPESDWQNLAEALRLSPSSYGLQPWRFILVQNPDVRKRLTAVSWNQPQIESCSHLVVFASLKKVKPEHIQKYINRICEVRNLAVNQLQGFHNLLISSLINGPNSEHTGHWSQRQTYIAIGTLLTCSALLGVDACPMEGIDPNGYDEILGLSSSDYSTIAVVALGYRSDDDTYSKLKKVRFEAQDIFQIIP